MQAGSDPFSNTLALLAIKGSVKNVKEQLHSCLLPQERFGSLHLILQRRTQQHSSPGTLEDEVVFNSSSFHFSKCSPLDKQPLSYTYPKALQQKNRLAAAQSINFRAL